MLKRWIRFFWQLNPTALFGFVGLAMVFGGVACYDVPAACVLTGLLVYRDATTPDDFPTK